MAGFRFVMYLLLSCMYRDNCDIEIVAVQQISELKSLAKALRLMSVFAPVQPAWSIDSPNRPDVQQIARQCLFAHSRASPKSPAQIEENKICGKSKPS